MSRAVNQYCEPWEYENCEHVWEQSAYGVVRDDRERILFDTLNSDVAEIQTEHDEHGAHRSDEAGRRNLTRIVACVNLLAGVPDAVLAGPRSDVQVLALAVLRGDGNAVAPLLDECLDRFAAESTGRPFVGRMELAAVLREVLGLFNREVHPGEKMFQAWIGARRKDELLGLLEMALCPR